MLSRYLPKENELQSPTPQFSHDPNFIVFRSWTTLLSLEAPDFGEVWSNDSAVLLMDQSAGCGAERVPTRKPVYFGNAASVAQLNVSLVETRSGQNVFSARQWPAGRFLHLEFLKEGSYTLHYSPAFSQVTIHRDVLVRKPSSSPVPLNFHPQLQTQLQTPRARINFNAPFLSSHNNRSTHLNFNSPFPEYNSARGLRVPKK